MVDLEFYNDKMNEDDIWFSVDDGITEDEYLEFKEKYTDMITTLKEEVDTLEDNLEEALDELSSYVKEWGDE